MTFDEALDTYMSMRMRGYAESTGKAHRLTLRRLQLWVAARLSGEVTIGDIDAIVLGDYLISISPPRLSASSYNNYRQYLKLFFDFCRAEGWIDADPIRHSRPARVRKGQRLRLRPEQVMAMMDAVGPRDRFAIALGFNTSLRASDIAALTVGAVDRRAGYIDAFIHKTQERMRLPLTADLAAELDRWLPAYLAATGGDGYGQVPPHWLLVPSMHQQAVDMRRLELGTVVVYRPLHPLKHPERVVHRGLEAINLPTLGEGFHTLRRSSARHLHDIAGLQGARNPTRIAQAQLGHRSQANTEVYLGIRPDEIERDEMLRLRPFLTWSPGATPKPACACDCHQPEDNSGAPIWTPV